jgi:uncharacterized protein (TIGR03437 family)
MCFSVYANAESLAPGSYSGAIVIRGGQQSITIQVRLSVTARAPVVPPVLGSVANAASGIPAALSPGEIVAIHGQNLAPGTTAPRVLIGGFPAPILSTSPTQINTVVPYEVAGQSAIAIQLQNMNGSTAQWTVPTAASAPGIFTVDGTGIGSAAVRNADSSLNVPSNPAAHGTTIQIFATGEGLTSPPGTTGAVATDQHQPVLPVGVKIGGVSAQIVYAGSAPGAIQGLFQVNAIVPSEVTPGDAVPILLTVGQAHSQTGTIIAVQ